MALSNFPALATAWSIKLAAKALAAALLEVRATGLDNVPGAGPVLVVARHYHHLFDGLALLASIPRPLHLLVTLDWTRSQWQRSVMAGLTRAARWPAILRADLLRPVGRAALSSPREIARLRKKAFADCVKLLSEERLLVIFPEGYPNIDPHFTPKTAPEEFLPFKAGFAAIATIARKRLQREVPIVPAGLRYQRAGRWRAYLCFGAAVYAADFSSRAALISHVETEVRRLSRRLE